MTCSPEKILLFEDMLKPTKWDAVIVLLDWGREKVMGKALTILSKWTLDSSWKIILADKTWLSIKKNQEIKCCAVRWLAQSFFTFEMRQWSDGEWNEKLSNYEKSRIPQIFDIFCID